MILAALVLSGCAATFNAGAALVNGVKIDTAELERAVDASAAATGQAAPEGEARLAQEREVLGRLIRDELLRQEALSQGVEVGDEQVEAELSALKAQFASEQEFQQRIEQAGFTEASLREQIRLRMAVDEIRAGLRPEIDAADVRAAYDAARAQYEQARIRHILFQTPPGGDGQAQERRARATLVELQAGASFAELAAERSDDPGSADQGGRLPGWTPLSALDQGFAAGVRAADVGEVTEPVRSQFGWHLILVDAKRTQPFSQVRADLRAQLEDQGADAEFQVFLSALAGQADVEVNPRYGDWDPGTAAIVEHRFFTPPEPDIESFPVPGA